MNFFPPNNYMNLNLFKKFLCPNAWNVSVFAKIEAPVPVLNQTERAVFRICDILVRIQMIRTFD